MTPPRDSPRAIETIAEGPHDSTNGSRSTFQESVREEITQVMDVDKNSQWTVGVNMQDVEGVVVDIEKDDDSPMDIYPTASNSHSTAFWSSWTRVLQTFPNGYCGIA